MVRPARFERATFGSGEEKVVASEHHAEWVWTKARIGKRLDW